MKKLFVLLLSLFVLGACDSGSDPKSIKLKTEEDKTFYAMGVMLGSNLARLNLTDAEIASLYKGLHASAKGQDPEVDMQVYQPKIQTMFRDRMQKSAQNQKKGGQEYLEKFLKDNKDAKKTKSGLVYQVLKAGDDSKPTAEDTVEVHYHGTLTDGTVFDSSVERKKTVSFPLNRVIKGWTEGLQLIGKGGKIKLIIPPELGYGDAGAPPKIPGGSTLVFEVELFDIKKAQAPKKKK
jgi:FKBP-type peptidyl-prolyl cis-trans isomerase FkpA